VVQFAEDIEDILHKHDFNWIFQSNLLLILESSKSIKWCVYSLLITFYSNATHYHYSCIYDNQYNAVVNDLTKKDSNVLGFNFWHLNIIFTIITHTFSSYLKYYQDFFIFVLEFLSYYFINRTCIATKTGAFLNRCTHTLSGLDVYNMVHNIIMCSFWYSA